VTMSQPALLFRRFGASNGGVQLRLARHSPLLCVALAAVLAGAEEEHPQATLRWPVAPRVAGRAANCGAESVLAYCWARGRPLSVTELAQREKDFVWRETTNLLEIQRVLRSLGEELQGMELSWDEVVQRPLPAIAWVDREHFECVETITSDWVRVFRAGHLRIERADDLRRRFSGRALVPSNHAKPKLKVGNAIATVGPLARGQVQWGEWAVVNESPDPVTLADPLASWWLHPEEEFPVTVAPGATVQIRFRVSAHAQMPRAERLEGHLALRASGNAPPLLLLSVTAPLCSAVSVEPGKLVLGPPAERPGRRPSEGQVCLTGPTGQGWRITSCEASAPGVEASVVSQREAPNGVVAWVRVRLTAPPETPLFYVIVRTNDALWPEFRVPVAIR